MGGASWWVGLAVVQRLKCIDGCGKGPPMNKLIINTQIPV